MAYAVRVAYPTVLLIFLIVASIYVDLHSGLEGIAFLVFVCGSIAVMLETTFHAVETNPRDLVRELFWLILVPLVLPFIRYYVFGGSLEIWTGVVESCVYLLIPTLPFLIELYHFGRDRDMRITASILGVLSLTQFVWFILFLIQTDVWPMNPSLSTMGFYLLLATLCARAWINPLQRIRTIQVR